MCSHFSLVKNKSNFMLLEVCSLAVTNAKDGLLLKLVFFISQCSVVTLRLCGQFCKHLYPKNDQN